MLARTALFGVIIGFCGRLIHHQNDTFENCPKNDYSHCVRFSFWNRRIFFL